MLSFERVSHRSHGVLGVEATRPHHFLDRTARQIVLRGCGLC